MNVERNNSLLSWTNKNFLSNNINDDITSEKSQSNLKYLYLLVILMAAFFLLSYYLFNIATNYKKKTKNCNLDINNSIPKSKHKNLTNLSLANLVRGISLLCIFGLSNRIDNDVYSFANYFCHVFPSLLFYSVFFTYIRFLIEKFYEIQTKKKDIFFAPSIQFFTIVTYILIFLLILSCISSENYFLFMYVGTGMISLLGFVLSSLFLFYGIRLANLYSTGTDTYEIKEKRIIHNRV